MSIEKRKEFYKSLMGSLKQYDKVLVDNKVDTYFLQRIVDFYNRLEQHENSVNSEGLQPCPFCGCKQVEFRVTESEKGFYMSDIYCINCLCSIDASMGMWDRHADVKKSLQMRWNARCVSISQIY